MLVIPPPQRNRRGGRRQTTPQAALTLVNATYSATPSPVLTLSYDRPVNIAEYSGSEITVNDAANSESYTGGEATLPSPAVVRIALVNPTPITGSGVHLTATRDNGLIAADDAGAWSGCTNLPIPFS